MAREYARIKVSIWGDLDFRSLSTDAQHLYFLLLTSPSTNLAGVSDWRPARMSALALRWSAKKVRDAGAELDDAGYIVIDDDTEEILIRSFVRHDGILKGPKTVTGMLRELHGVYSVKIISAVRAEIRRAISEDPSLKGIEALSGFLDTPSDTKSDTPSAEHAESMPIPQPSTLNHNPQPTTLSPARLRAADVARSFDDFWALYPKKVEKPNAEKAWRAAVKKNDPAEIIAGLRRQLPSIAMQRKSDGDYRKAPHRWLNAECWKDEPEEQTEQPSTWSRATLVRAEDVR